VPLAPRHPWFKFFPADWAGDEKLGACSLAARGLLVELLCIMHRATPYGHLVVDGRPATDTYIARIARTGSVSEVRRALRELLEHEVLSTTAEGVVYSRKMVRQAARSANGREHGKRGGNPLLLGNPGDYPKPLRVVDNTHMPEARSQNPPLTPLSVSVVAGADVPVLGGASRRTPRVKVDGFDRFWAAYPKKRARKDAEKAWVSLQPDDALQAAMLAALTAQRQTRDWEREGGRFIPYPSSWLNGRRWEDAMSPEVAGSPVPGPSVDRLDAGAARAVPDAEETALMLAARRAERASSRW
jgi:hypothetical protein